MGVVTADRCASPAAGFLALSASDLRGRHHRSDLQHSSILSSTPHTPPGTRPATGQRGRDNEPQGRVTKPAHPSHHPPRSTGLMQHAGAARGDRLPGWMLGQDVPNATGSSRITTAAWPGTALSSTTHPRELSYLSATTWTHAHCLMDGFARGSADRVERHIGGLWTAGVAHGLAAGERWCPGVPCPGGPRGARATTSAFAGVSAVVYS